VHNAFIKIYIDMNDRPEKYLTTNITTLYVSKVVGGESTARSATRGSPRLQARHVRRHRRPVIGGADRAARDQ